MLEILFSFLLVLVKTNFVIEPEFEFVTVGSVVKLTNAQNAYKLHSHEIGYGTGSGQQSVTGFREVNDPNSFFKVESISSTRGQVVRCDDIIQLEHLKTKKRLHSHRVASPISNQQEVSCYDQPDSGDNWKVICQGSWKREAEISLLHVDTGKYLSSQSKYKFNRPIEGQLEVACRSQKSKSENWIAQEGIYISSESY
jgi:dolichyl-phosphate-mannose--protein O-mannosyl transferase